MDYKLVGTDIRHIREKELKQTRSEFAEKIGISTITLARLENGTSNVTNIEVYHQISAISGYTIEELILDENDRMDNQRIIRKISYLLNILSVEELDYIYDNINNFVKLSHKEEKRTLKDIKRKFKENRD